MLAEELVVVDGDAPLFRRVRPLLDVALRLDSHDTAYRWHGWDKQQINAFLASLPPACCLVVGVWETESDGGETAARERLTLGCVCEVRDGQVHTLRTFESLAGAGLKSVGQLEPGIEDALEIMRAARTILSPVAWALFMEKAAWDEWLFASCEDEAVIDKGELLASLARQGRCVLMGSQTRHPHAH
ncbi:MAG TPA: hypothetical protein VNE38_05745 [Ktedonobacteraceae bacterium]|nr:hypothetical protein [Ktedonobacteraceae bacterium]